ncbi:MAG: hypothetical protein JWM80_1494 [Cyanobacteria bacterium RYN_339]|nr:hypothetical protein [Cyanobacteria bacterium RYN_339]
MGNRGFYLLVALAVAATIAYPLWQAWHTGGWICYQNGYDETTYLSYRFSLVAQAVTRPGSCLVTLLHRLGVPGGWQNLALDGVAVVAFPLLVRAGWHRWSGDERWANLAALLLLLLPLAFLTIDPPVRWLFQANQDAWTLAWINVPELHTPPLVRTPEPQVSLVLLSLAVWAAVARARAAWPVYLVLPFLYPFVSIPAAFVALALDLRRRLPEPAALAGAFAAVGVACWGYFHFLIGPKLAPLLVDSHLPMVSFTGCLALAALGLRVAPGQRFLAVAVALAPWVACNQQLLSGHLAQPDNFEQYFGCFAAAFVVALAVRERPAWRWMPLVVGLVFFLRASQVVFTTNAATNARLPLTPELLSALATDPAHVAINDMILASTVGMLHARQAPTALAMEGTFPAVADGYVAGYRCAKRRILLDHPLDPGFAMALRFLDAAYTYGSQDYKMNHIGRRSNVVIFQDVDPARCESDAPVLRYFLAR